MRYGALTAAKEIAERDGDGLQTPIASTSLVPDAHARGRASGG